MNADDNKRWLIDKTIMEVHCQAAKEALAILLAKDKIVRRIEIDEHLSKKWCPICTRR